MAILLFISIFTAIIKIKFKFWSIQPVFHLYNIWYWLFPPGIINLEEPTPNKYTNLNDIIFVEYNTLSNIDKNNFILFIQQYYLNTTDVKYKPKPENIIPYFQNTKKSFFSMFYEKDYKISNHNIVKTNQKLIAVMTSRLLNVCIRNNDFTTYYVDYLCVHKDKRNQGIAQQIIQTHDYYQRTQTNIPTSLFKKEGKLHAMVPLVIYRTYGFNIEYWENKVVLHPNIQMVIFNKNNINLLTNFIKSNKNLFDLYVCPDINILIDLINTNNIIIYALIQNKQILCVYFLRDSSTFYNQRKAIECFASINNSKDSLLFINGLSLILKKLKNTYSYLLIENISHNYIIIESIIKKHTPYIVSPTAYYFYNFAISPIIERKALIIF
jgi:hypothetical protein|tara:strand:- start:6956 stop:8101 length:1146 start_codon:yes stop_codon:yes gene_type:complete